jgi:hypothetical protein
MQPENVPEIYLRVGRVRVFISSRETPMGPQYQLHLGRLSPRSGPWSNALGAYRHNLPELVSDIELLLLAIRAGFLDAESPSAMH